MNKDLLKPFIKISSAKYGDYKVTETDQVINYCWERKEHQMIWITKALERIREYAKKNNWSLKGEEHSTIERVWDRLVYPYESPDDPLQLKWAPSKLSKEYFSICYDKAKDKVSLSYYSNGLGRTRFDRIHPISRNIPLLCISKHIYVFKQVRKPGQKRYSYQPRIYTGRFWRSELVPYLQEVLKCNEEVLKLNVSYTHMKHQALQSTTMANAYGSVIDHGVGFLKDVFRLNGKTGGFDYNGLIDASGNKPTEVVKMMLFRKDEGTDHPPYQENQRELLYQCADFLNEDWFKESIQIKLDSLPF